MLDFILIRQKDHINALVRDDKFDEALAKLDFIKELWLENSYGYKYDEIHRNIRERLRELVGESTHWKQEQKWRNMMDKVA